MHGHQARRKLNDVSFQPQLLQRIGGFQPQQATADDHTALAFTGTGGDRIQIVQRAVHKAAFALMSRHRRHKRARTGRQHQFIPAQCSAVAVVQATLLTIDRLHPTAAAQFNAVLGKKVLANQRELRGLFAGEVLRQVHAIVGRMALFAVHHDVILLMQITRYQLFQKMVADHAVTHDG